MIQRTLMVLVEEPGDREGETIESWETPTPEFLLQFSPVRCKDCQHWNRSPDGATDDAVCLRIGASTEVHAGYVRLRPGAIVGFDGQSEAAFLTRADFGCVLGERREAFEPLRVGETVFVTPDDILKLREKLVGGVNWPIKMFKDCYEKFREGAEVWLQTKIAESGLSVDDFARRHAVQVDLVREDGGMRIRFDLRLEDRP